MNSIFDSSADAREFIKTVAETQARIAGTPLTEFERELLDLRSGDLLSSRINLAERFGITDSGRSSISNLTELLRQSRKNKSVPAQHPSGKSVDDLLRTAEQILDPLSDFSWLIVRDSRHRPMTKLDTFLAKVIFTMLFAGFLFLLFWKAVLTGVRLAVGIFALLAIALLVEVFRRRAIQRQIPKAK